MDAATKCHQALGVGNLSMIRFAPLKTKMEPVFMAEDSDDYSPQRGTKHPSVHISLSYSPPPSHIGDPPIFLVANMCKFPTKPWFLGGV